MPDAAIEAARGAEILVLDALRYADHPTHMTVDEALAVAARVQSGSTYFTHMCHELGHAETEKNLPPGVRLAYDGLRLTL